MKYKIITLFLLFTGCATMAYAQKYIVMSITGHIAAETPGTARHELRLRETLTPQSILNIPYKAQVELLDEKAKKKYVLKTPGKGSVGSMVANRQNSVIQLTTQYLAYAKSRLLGNGELSSRHYSDPATVTREVAVSRNPYEEEFNAFRQEAQRKYDEFRLNAIRTYAQFVKEAWEAIGAQPPKPMPSEDNVPPVTAPEEDEQKQMLEEKKLIPAIDTIKIEMPIEPQPLPITPIREQEEDSIERIDFIFFGTPLHVRFSHKETFTMGKVTEEAVADVFNRFASLDYNNTIRDCLELRHIHQLGDWAYLQMLDALASACFQDRNESILFMAYLYQQSGYKMRLAMTDDSIYMLYTSRHTIFQQPYYVIDGDNFYVYGGDINGLRICTASYPGEKPLSLIISKPMVLSENNSDSRHLKSARFENMDFSMEVNKNLIDFYETYPTSMIDDNIMTRWAIYANTPIDITLSENLLQAIRSRISGLSPYDAAEQLLNWVQTAFQYEYDDAVWGGDRAFFAEESLYYPYCDCEDRSILFSRLVRDLLGLKVCLVYYPGHLATAVSFPGHAVKGDFLLVGGEPYIVCDPTFIGAKIGLTMPGMDNTAARVILLSTGE